jgi:hypothetical protein
MVVVPPFTMTRAIAGSNEIFIWCVFDPRVAELNAILDRAPLEDFTVRNQNRSLTAVALEMLSKAGWISN